MQTITCTLVGFGHHGWRGDDLGKRLSEARGKRVVLMREEDNDRNSDATIGFIDTLKVCYVANDECHATASYLQNSLSEILEGTVTEVDVANKRCKAVVSVDETTKITPPNEDCAFKEWEQRHQELPTMRTSVTEQRLAMLQRDTMMLLASGAALDGPLKANLESYISLMRLDISREATVCRRQIADMMGQSHDEEIRMMGRNLEVMITAMGSDATCAALVRYIGRELPKLKPFTDMIQRNAHFDLQQLEQALADFPYHLYDEYKVSQADFVSRLYYRQIPGRILRRFLSALLLLQWRKEHTSEADLQAEMANKVLEYVDRLSPYVAEPWQGHTSALWKAIIAKYQERLAQTGKAKNVEFNARFVCMVAGRLIQNGVYDQQISQTRYGELMKLNNIVMRTSINKALCDNTDVRRFVDSLSSKPPSGNRNAKQ